MVGLRDIPCVGVAVDKISEATVEAATRGLRYMLCYKRFLNDLSSEIEKVKIQEERVAEKIVEAKDDGKIIKDHVVAWQGNVENVKTEADQLARQTTSSTCFKFVHFPNPISRFRLGRKAAHLAKTVTQHTDSGKDFFANEIGHYAPDENIPISDTSYQIFGSRQEAYEKLWTTLVNNNGCSIIGIYGMPGAGKTRMMEQAWKELKDKKIFDKVTRANVGGEELDVIKLQDQLSGYLSCRLQSKDNEAQRASQLKSSLMNGGKILVILDDVWDVIPLIKIGIPFGDGSSKGCKILLTSRKQNVCLGNNCTDPIEIKSLRNDEAWEMFRSTVGSSKIESLEDPSLAKKVCKKCGALPLLINAVGRALKVLTENSWKDALNQLENFEYQEIDGIDPKAYTCLKFSFEKLAKGEKACLFLCSFFREDAEIDIKMLFDMATGSQLLGNGRNIEGLVDILKSSSLLLQGKDVDKVKVHDIIRDVARSLAAGDPNYAFLSLRCRSRLPDNEEYRTRRLLQLDLEGENVGFPDDLACPDLHTLWIQSNKHSQQLSSGFFNAFVNIKVLLLRGKLLFDHQLTIHNLENLRVVILSGCKMISQTFLSSVSRNLETLFIWNCDLPSPLDFPELKKLRKLELVVSKPIEIAEKALSRLSSLEELIVPGGFKTRDDDDDASISWELSQLGCLRNLVIKLNKLWHYPDRDIFSSLVEFNIQAGDHEDFRSGAERKYINFRLIDIERWSMPMVERAEQLRLDEVTGLANGFSDSNMEKAFAKLKHMTICDCEDMEHLASWEGRNQRLTCFTNLNVLKIFDCNRLKYVFSYSVAKCLLQLQHLSVRGCPEMEEIIRVDDSTDHDGQEIICFPNLESLYLYDLPSLTSFCTKKVTFPGIISLNIENLKTFDLLEEIFDYSSSTPRTLSISYKTIKLLPSQLKFHLQNLEELKLENCWWPGQYSLFDGSLTFNTLEKLEVAKCPVSALFTSSVFRSLHQLQELEVSRCGLLKEIVEEDAKDDGSNEKTPISLLHLQSLTLSKLPNLQNIGISACYMPALVSVNVNRCGLITSLFTRSAAFTNLQHLMMLHVSNCSLLKEIVEEEEEDARDDGTNEKTPISLLHLESLFLSKLPNLQNIGSCGYYMPALVDVNVDRCGLITSLFTLSAFRNFQHMHTLQVSDCSLLKVIVEDEMDDATPGMSEEMISLPLLTTITLENLPRLISFSSSTTFTFNMPALDCISLSECPCIDEFTSLRITAPPASIFFNSDDNQEMTDESQGQGEEEEEGGEEGEGEEEEEDTSDGAGDLESSE